MSSFLKKRVPHNIYKREIDNIDYIEKVSLLRGPYEVDLKIEMHVYEGHITPTRFIFKKQVSEIIEVYNKWIIHGFTVTTENGNVRRVSLVGYHPNQDPDTGLYCLHPSKIGLQYNDYFYENLVTNIKTYYLDECYFTPPDKEFKYKKLNTIAFQFNEGDTQ